MKTVRGRCVGTPTASFRWLRGESGITPGHGDVPEYSTE